MKDNPLIKLPVGRSSSSSKSSGGSSEPPPVPVSPGAAQPGAGKDGSIAGSPEQGNVMEEAHKIAKRRGVKPGTEEFGQIMRGLWEAKGY